MKSKPLSLYLLLLAGSPLLPSCASNQALRASLADRDQLIRDLRAENQATQQRLKLVTHDRDELRTTLTNQAMEVPPAPIEASADTRRPTPDPADYGPVIDTAGLDVHGISLERQGDSVIFGIPASATFASGSATLSMEGEKALDAVIPQLKTAFPDGARFFIEGHTDSERIKRSKFASNRDLSYHRARAVHEYLVTRGQIEDKRFVVVAHGPHHPRDTNDSKEGRSNNRRVEIVVRP